MKMLTSAHLFAPAKRARKTKDWFERAKLIVAAARAHPRSSVGVDPMRPPTVLQRHRLVETLNAKS
jgi:hypothetical protein